MEKIKFSYKNAENFMRSEEISQIEAQLKLAHEMLHQKTGVGSDFVGWVDLPKKYDKDEFKRVKAAGEKIKKDSELLLVVGIGGSYLGARAAIEALTHTFSQSLTNSERKHPQILFVGQNISGTYLSDLLDLLDSKDYSINVISKSGTTTEPALAFRVLKKHIEKKYGKEEAKSRIYATTDREKGALKKLATEEGYETFVIPDDVGGRFSVITPVGLLPICASGIDIDKLMEGALHACEDLEKPNLENLSFQYAAVRNILHKKGKSIELLVNYEPKLHFVSEWWKQLFGESEGKDGKGIFPGAVDFSTDLHSMGQYVQEGQRILFETTIHVGTVKRDIIIESELSDLDGLNYLEGKDFAFVNKKAAQGTILAHVDGGVPNLEIMVPELSPYYIGYLFYFFMKSCGISGYLLGVNPFDQPGVEAYKRNMFALLGKEGYETLSEELNKRLK